MSPHAFRRHGRRHARLAPAQERAGVAPPSSPVCPVCGQPVRELVSAVTHRGSGTPAHFDCIVKELRETNELGAQERLCYLGGGVFGVLAFRTEGNPGSYVIKRRIPYESREAPQAWKKPLQVEC